jgi:phosphate transport system permease protein
LPIALFAAIYLRDSKEKNPQFVETANRIAGRIIRCIWFFGLVIIVPLIQDVLTCLWAKLLWPEVLLAIMALPTIITISEDAMRNRAMKEASLALGASHWQTIYKVVILIRHPESQPVRF